MYDFYQFEILKTTIKQFQKIKDRVFNYNKSKIVENLYVLMDMCIFLANLYFSIEINWFFYYQTWNS